MYAVKYIGMSIEGYLKKARRVHVGIYGSANYIPCPKCGIGFIKKESKRRSCPLCSTRRRIDNRCICVRCGILFSAGSKARTTKWCPECRELVRREQTKKRVAAYRKRNVTLSSED